MSTIEERFYGTAAGMLDTIRLTGWMLRMGIIIFFFSAYLGKVQIIPEYYDIFMQCPRMTNS
jgi:hypothetical protein